MGWSSIVWSIIQALSLLIGLAGVPDDLERWAERWLPSAWKWVTGLPVGWGVVLSLLLFVVGIWLLAKERFEPVPTWYRSAARRVRSRPWRRSHRETEESPPTADQEDELGEHEVAALRVVAQHVNDPDEGITPSVFQRKMALQDFRGADGTLALASLRERGMLEKFEYEDWNGDTYSQYRLTPLGTGWLNANRASLTEHDDIPF